MRDRRSPLLLLLFAGACVFSDDTDGSAARDATPAAAAPAAPAAQPAPRGPALSIEVDLSARELRVLRDGGVVETHPAAVGSREWPTPTGEWTITQVIINPRWVPPKEESWAEEEVVAEPGDPDNPLGRVQLVYDPPNSIHGTNEPESVGQAVSHGSIRVTNEVGIALARQVLAAGGARRDSAWVEQALAHPTQRQEVSLPRPVPIRVVEGSGSGASAGR